MGDLLVLGTGFGRTGTLSLKHALDHLGLGPTYHMQEALKRPSHLRAWRDHSRGRTVDWDRLLVGFPSTVDYPACLVWRELLALHPEARVVHTVRDPERWWTSARDTIHGARTMFPRWVRALLPLAADYVEVTDRLVWDGLFSGRFLDRDHAIEVFERHTAEVVAGVPADRLLVFDVAQGWEPLCAFLDVDVPDVPFPRVNDAASIRRKITAVRVGTRVLPPLAAGAAAVALRRRTRR